MSEMTIEQEQIFKRIAKALERIADNQEKVMGLTQDADAFMRVVVGS